MEIDSGELPPDPVSHLSLGASHLHEVYLGYVEAGFSQDQALYLCGQILKAAFATQPND